MQEDKRNDEQLCQTTYSQEDFLYIALIKLLMDYQIKEWEQFRILAANHPKSPKIYNYFDKLFKNKKIHIFNLKKNTKVFRARVIKKHNIEQTGIFKKDIINEFYSIFLTKQQKKLSINDIKFSPDEILMAHLIKGRKTSPDEMHKLEEFMGKYKKSDFYGFEQGDCGVPPMQYRKDGRLNDKKDEYLYLSLEPETTIYELKPSISQNYSIAEGVVHKKLKLINLRDYDDLLDNNFAVIVDSIAEANSDELESFYYLTQELTHYIQKEGFDGILYKSAVKSDGSNILLFNQGNIKFVSSSVVTIDNINIQYSQLFPLKNNYSN